MHLDPDTAAPMTARRRVTWSGLAFQLVLIVLAVLLYFGVRGLTQSSAAEADDNARGLVSFERSIGANVEEDLQGAIIDHDVLVTLVNWVYIYGHWPVVALTLGLLFALAPGSFRLLRDAMFLSGAIGLVIFALYPVAPPRFGLLDVVDTVTDRSESYRTLQPPALINPFAAMPSLHFGWNLLIGVVLWNTTRNPFVRALAVASPVLMGFAVVATGNHYVVDVIGGGIVALTGLALARRLPDDPVSALRRRAA